MCPLLDPDLLGNTQGHPSLRRFSRRFSLVLKSSTACFVREIAIGLPLFDFSAGMFHTARASFSSVHSAEYKFDVRTPVTRSNATHSAKSRFFSESRASRNGLRSFFSRMISRSRFG